LKGLRLLKETNADDYAHVLVACLFHDIGYVRGILDGDNEDGYVIDAKGNKAELARGSSDAALLPYHVDRSKLYVMRRFAKHKLVDAARIANAIESTRFPPVVATVVTKKARWYAPPISLANSAIPIICARPMRFITNLKKSE